MQDRDSMRKPRGALKNLVQLDTCLPSKGRMPAIQNQQVLPMEVLSILNQLNSCQSCYLTSKPIPFQSSLFTMLLSVSSTSTSGGNRTPNRRFWKPVLYQLSYARKTAWVFSIQPERQSTILLLADFLVNRNFAQFWAVLPAFQTI